MSDIKKGIRFSPSLCVTHSCNLDCIYCYQKHDGNNRMSFETACKSIDWIFENVPDDMNGIEITFIGGEPLIEFELIKKVYEYTHEKYPDDSYIFYATTNGVLLNDDMKAWFREHKSSFVLGLSLDGLPETHNHNRSNSYEKIDIPFFRDTWPDQGVKMTISEYSLKNFADNVIYIHNLGFKEIDGVNLYEGEFDWSDERYVRNIIPELKKLVDFYVENDNLMVDQMLGRQIDMCEEKDRPKRKWCGIGTGTIFFDTDGTRRPCPFVTPMTFTFAKKACELNLGYLFINRNIPSLSGGELQRLRLIQVFSSQLSDLLIVLDEPLAGLSLKEKNVVYNNVLGLSKRHTLLVVDHHEMFFEKAKRIITLGEGGGKKGGKLIDTKAYIKEQRQAFKLEPLPIEREERIHISSDVYAYKGVDLRIAPQRLNIISGSSGVGKSTLLREYFPQTFDSYLYINQKPMGGNVRSTVATGLDIANRIIQIFAKKHHQDKTFFSNMASADGVCRTCGGTGIITFGSDSQSQVCLECKDCRGTGFDRRLEKFKINNDSIQDIWKMTIDEGIEFFTDVDGVIAKQLIAAQNLLLGHLQIGEKISDLSGGENIRMKLIKALSANNEVIGIDEPFKGLSNKEIYMVIKSLDELVSKGKTIIVIDHEENAFKYFSKHITLVNDKGILKDGK